MTMTAEEAREAVTVAREALGRAMRALSVPVPDWAGAAKELDSVNELSCELWRGCIRESWRAAERGETS